MMHSLARRLATTEDIPWLLELRKQTMKDYLDQSGFDTSEVSLRDRILYKFNSTEIIHTEVDRIGMIKIDRGTPFWTLVQIQIAPAFQGKGIASKLIRKTISETHQASTGVSLSVLKVNPARALYERLGFIVTGENEHSYEMQYKSG